MPPCSNKRLLLYLGLILLGIANLKQICYFLQWGGNKFFGYEYHRRMRLKEQVPVFQVEKDCGVNYKCPKDSFPLFLSTASETDNRPRLCVAGKYVIKPPREVKKGINAATVNPDTFEVVSVRSFDISLKNTSQQILFWIEEIPFTDIIILFTSDDASSLSDTTRALFNSIGSGRIQNLQYRSQWYMITQKEPLGFTVFEKITYSIKQTWGDAVEFRGCIPKKIPKKSIIADDPVKQNIERVDFCKGKNKEQYKGFCNEPRFETIKPALVTNITLLRNELYTIPIFLFASSDFEVFLSSLDNLIHQPGVDLSLITVLYDSNSNDIPDLAKIYGVQSNKTNFTNTFQERLKQARRINRGLFPRKKYLMVLDSEVIPSPDFLYFFSQLFPVFVKDKTVSAISGWSCNCYSHNGSLQMVHRVTGLPKYGALISAESRKSEFFEEIFTPDVARLQGPEACHFPSLDAYTVVDRPQDLSKDLYYQKLVMLQQLGHVIKEEVILDSCSKSVIKEEINVVYVELKDNSLSKILQCLGILNNNFAEYNGIVRLSVDGKAVMIITNDSAFYKSRPIAHQLRKELELSKNELKTSTQIGLPYQPARMSMNEKMTLQKVPKMKVAPSLRVDSVYTTLSGYRTTYREAFKVPVQDDFVINSKMLKQPKESLRTTVTRPLSFGNTEYNSEYRCKDPQPCIQGISVEKMTTCPMKVVERDEREPLPLTENYGRFLDIYLSTSRLAHRAFSLEEQRTIAAKNIVTVYESMQIPKGRGFGCKFPQIPGQDLDDRDPDMIDTVMFKVKPKLRNIPTRTPGIPYFGNESVMQASYKRPQGVALLLQSENNTDFPKAVNTLSTKQALCPPGMYTTELSAINNHTSPQAVV